MSPFYANSLQHLRAEFERIDLLLRAYATGLHGIQGSIDEFQGLYISKEEFETLIEQPAGHSTLLMVNEALGSRGWTEKITQRKNRNTKMAGESLSRGIRLRLPELREMFSLDSMEIDIFNMPEVV